jgi:hypothetical protein
MGKSSKFFIYFFFCALHSFSGISIPQYADDFNTFFNFCGPAGRSAFFFLIDSRLVGAGAFFSLVRKEPKAPSRGLRRP